MQRWSTLFIPTLREAPADAEVASHKLLLRAGYIRQLGAGIYSYLPLGQRSINKIIAIIREEMDRIGQEFLLPALNPAEIWQQSGRWTAMGENMFRLKDRKGAELCLAMTHEEVMTSIARNELRSYKQLPQIWYQIQTKFRDEPRPKAGLLRIRQFLMKDAYSFDIDEAGLDLSYQKHDRAYRAIFDRCGLTYVAVDADSGAMGGSASQEFMVYTDAGEDLIASCPVCGYAANLEKATSRLDAVEDAPMSEAYLAEVHTPGQRSIEQISLFLGVEKTHLIKTLAFTAPAVTHRYVKQVEGGFSQGAFDKGLQHIFVLLRGDHELSESKLSALLATHGIKDHLPADEASLRLVGAVPGYMGPVGLKRPDEITSLQVSATTIILDSALEGRKHLIAGANKEEYHLRNVTPGRDFTPTLVADVRNASEGEACPTPNCSGKLKLGKAVEIGHIFKLGQKYTESMGARVLNQAGEEVIPIMGSYGIGVERILTAAIEQAALAVTDERGKGSSFALPAAIAPYQVVVTITNIGDAALRAAGESLAADIEAAGIDVLLDDRDERAGVKFKDADLVGIPYRVTIGKKLAEGKVELVDRLANHAEDVTLAEVTAALLNRLR